MASEPPTVPGSPLKRHASLLREQLTAALREDILEGVLPPGIKLNERTLCARFEVSRSLMRETLQQLASEALIERVPYRGLRVAAITERDARQIYAVRSVLEGLIAAQFCANARAEHVARLSEAADAVAALTAHDAPAALLAAKNAFYAAVMEGADNDVATHLLTLVNNRITVLRRLSLSRAGRLPAMQAEIAALVEALVAREAETARRLSEAHVGEASEAAMAALAQHAPSRDDPTPDAEVAEPGAHRAVARKGEA